MIKNRKNKDKNYNRVYKEMTQILKIKIKIIKCYF